MLTVTDETKFNPETYTLDVYARLLTKGTPIAVAKYPNPKDYFLYLVCIEHRPGDFVTWTYNAQDGGFYSGHYFDAFEFRSGARFAALQDFADRLKRYAQ